MKLGGTIPSQVALMTNLLLFKSQPSNDHDLMWLQLRLHGVSNVTWTHISYDLYK